MIAWVLAKARMRVRSEVVRQSPQIGVRFSHPLADAPHLTG